MKILSVNVGLPRKVFSDHHDVTTGIYKSPVHGRVKTTVLNIEGDRQADLSAHGGPNKAVSAYPSEHYEYWRRELPGVKMPWGTFGENLTLTGLLEDNAHIGDRFRMGTVILMVTQPRLPCYKLGIKFGRDDMPERFLSSKRTGFYFAVVEEGELGKGDNLAPIHQDVNGISVKDILHLLYDHEPQDPELFKKALNVEALSPNWRKRLLMSLDHRKEDELPS
ncbi:MAG: MOSC domain-containing protein [Acidobacteria bacterium]|nr:MAG: MOSC domain-containing protein [Acidobacteriota bacterium]